MSLFKSTILDAATAAVAAPPRNPLALGGDDILALSKAIDLPDFTMPPRMVRPFFGPQKASFTYSLDAIARWGAVLIGDDMGMGKTQVALALVDHFIHQATTVRLRHHARPSVTKAGYMADLAASFPTLRFHHVHGRTADFASLPAADIYWMSDDTQSMRAWLTDTVTGNDGKARIVANDCVKGAAIITRDELHRDKGQAGKAKPASRAGVMQVIGERCTGQRHPDGGHDRHAARPTAPSRPTSLCSRSAARTCVKAVTPGAKKATDVPQPVLRPLLQRLGLGLQRCRHGPAAGAPRCAAPPVMRSPDKKDLGNLLPHGGWSIIPIALNGVLARYNRIAREFLQLVRDEDGVEAMWRKARAEAITKMSALREEAGKAKAQGCG